MVDALPPGVLRGIEQFNARDFFECHESIEEEWLRERGGIRLLYQGILQVGVAFHHVKRGKWKPAVTMLERGIPKLRGFAPSVCGIDVAGLIEGAERCECSLKELGPEGVNEFNWNFCPVIRLV